MTEKKEREAYADQLEARIREWVSGIDHLAARVDQSDPEIRLEFRKDINELRARGAAARARLEELREAQGEAWDDARIIAQRFAAELQSAVEEARERYS